MPSFKTDELYRIEMYKRNDATADAFCDLIVTDKHNTVYLANVIGQDSKVKRLFERFQEGRVGQINRAEGNMHDSNHIRHSIYAIAEKKNMYNSETIKTDSLTQMLIVAKNAQVDIKQKNEWQQEETRRIQSGKSQRLIPRLLSELVLAWDGDIQKQIFKVLNDRYNTPMLEEWADYIADCLVEQNYFEPLNVKCFGVEYNLEAGLLRVTEEQLEDIISEGVKSYELDFAIEEDGRSEEESILSDCLTIDDYLTSFANELAMRIQQNVRIRFDPDKDKHHPSFEDVNLQANKNGITGLYPPQANTVMGVSKTIIDDDYCFIVGEMGTGKTTMGLVTPYITEAMEQNVDSNPRPQRVIVFSPAIMVEKWAREIKERIPNAKTFQIKHWKDVLKIRDENSYINKRGKIKFKNPKAWEFYIMSSETPKFTYPMEPIKDWRTNAQDISFIPLQDADSEDIRRVVRMDKISDEKYEMVSDQVVDYKERIRFKEDRIFNHEEYRYETGCSTVESAYYCPRCGGPLTKRGGDLSDIHFFEVFNKSSNSWVKRQAKENLICTNEVSTATLPKEDIKEWKFDSKLNRKVPAESHQKCGFILWQPEKLPLDSGYRKVSPTWFINKYLPRGFFKYLIADEVHEYKSGDSTTGQAFGQLINHTEKQILLTGTLMGGMSRDIFYLLARLDPKKLLKEDITYKDEAVFNERYGISEHSTRGSNGRLRKSSAKKPGISPHLFPMYLMGNCAFLELNDMGYALPPYEEIPVVVDMDEEHRIAYNTTSSEIMEKLRSTPGLGGMNGVSLYINTMYQYADTPFNIGEVVAYDQEGNKHILDTPQTFDPDLFTPAKVTELIQTVDAELYDHGRKSLIYVRYTGKDSWNQADVYLYEKFKALGYNVGILKSNRSHDGIKMPKSSRDREQWLHDMMEKYNWDILITNPRLVKVGLDLLYFPNIHFFQLGYSTYDYMQAARRSWRIKQTKKVKVFTYVYGDTIQEKALGHIARKIDAAMAMQGKFSEEGLRAMADSTDGMTALAKQLMKDDVLEDVETVHDMFARKNQSFEEMQSIEYQDYESYVMNPIEGGIETVRKIAEGLIKEKEQQVESGKASKEELRKTKEAVSNYLDLYEQIVMTVENVKEYNKGIRSKKKRVVEGQQGLDLFAI